MRWAGHVERMPVGQLQEVETTAARTQKKGRLQLRREDFMERHEMIRRDMRWRETAAEEGGLYGET